MRLSQLTAHISHPSLTHHPSLASVSTLIPSLQLSPTLSPICSTIFLFDLRQSAVHFSAVMRLASFPAFVVAVLMLQLVCGTVQAGNYAAPNAKQIAALANYTNIIILVDSASSFDFLFGQPHTWRTLTATCTQPDNIHS